MRRVVRCTNCGSEKRDGRRCDSCLDRSDEEWALHDAREAFTSGAIEVSELERRVELALVAPPRRRHPTLVYR